MLPKMLLVTLSFVNLLLWLNVFMIGHEKGAPVSGIRKSLLKLVYRATVRIQTVIGLFTWINHRDVSSKDVNNYQDYLGPLDKSVSSSELKTTRPSAIVSNHMSFLDIYALILCPFFPSFTPNAGIRDAPIMNKLTDGLSSLYIERAGTPEERDKTVQAMIDRQAIIEKEDSEWPLLAIFPESTTTNGQYLLPFKRGAF